MKRKFLILQFLLIALKSFGQIDFEKGYIMDNENKKTECFIKNSDWINNPSEIKIKFNNTDSIKILSTSLLKEFCIYGTYKYIIRRVNIDRSGNNTRKITSDRNSIWSTELLVLKVLIEGKASLYSYEKGNVLRFFYSVSDTIKQLVYKKYIEEGKYIYSNTSFRQQLWEDLRCSNFDEKSVNSLGYTYDGLTKYFKRYNDCVGDIFLDYSDKANREFFNIKITPGINVSSISFDNSIIDDNDFSIKNYVCFRFGMESELILPFLNNKLGLFIEPTYNYFKSTKYLQTDTVTIRFNSIEFPIGLRYYFYLNQTCKMFLNSQVSLNFSYSFNSAMYFKKPPPYEIKDGVSFALGAGVVYDKFSFEFRYYSNKNILSSYNFLSTDYRRLSFIVGYKLYKRKT